jgi:hypothetical protein
VEPVGINIPSAGLPSPTKTGLELPRRLSFDRWADIGKQLSDISTSSAWCLGDWLAYGMEFFTGRYRRVIEQTGLEYQTLRNYAWVARRFPLSRRRINLSFGHHAEVVALSDPEQDYWLRKAEEVKWSVKQLRREVRASLEERKDLDGTKRQVVEGSPSIPETELSLRIPLEETEACRRAAALTGMQVEEWAINVVTVAARAALEA